MHTTGDAAMKDEDGYVFFLRRSNEIVKASAHRISTIEIESALLQNPAEATVVGRPDELMGETACVQS